MMPASTSTKTTLTAFQYLTTIASRSNTCSGPAPPLFGAPPCPDGLRPSAIDSTQFLGDAFSSGPTVWPVPVAPARPIGSAAVGERYTAPLLGPSVPVVVPVVVPNSARGEALRPTRSIAGWL